MGEEGKFGTIFYSESEYHHEGLHPPDVRRSRISYLAARPAAHALSDALHRHDSAGYGRAPDGSHRDWLGGQSRGAADEPYRNPFWNTTAFFKTSGGHSSRVSVFWHVATGGTERGSFYGDRMSYIMARPERSPNTVVTISKDGKTVIDANGYPEGKVDSQSLQAAESLREAARIAAGAKRSRRLATFITHEFVSAIAEDRTPEVNVWEAIAYTMPGIVAHQSAFAAAKP